MAENDCLTERLRGRMGVEAGPTRWAASAPEKIRSQERGKKGRRKGTASLLPEREGG